MRSATWATSRDPARLGWLRLHPALFVSGMLAGRRGLPAVAPDGAQLTPMLHRIHADFVQQAETVRAEALAATSGARMALATLTVPYGELWCREQQLDEAQRRLADVVEVGVATGRRAGEADLDDEMVGERRRREFEQRKLAATHQVEGERAEVSKTALLISRWEAVVTERDGLARARTVALRAAAVNRAAAYLAGALRTHPDRESLTAHLSRLLPALPTDEDRQ